MSNILRASAYNIIRQYKDVGHVVLIIYSIPKIYYNPVYNIDRGFKSIRQTVLIIDSTSKRIYMVI